MKLLLVAFVIIIAGTEIADAVSGKTKRNIAALADLLKEKTMDKTIVTKIAIARRLKGLGIVKKLGDDSTKIARLLENTNFENKAKMEEVVKAQRKFNQVHTQLNPRDELSYERWLNAFATFVLTSAEYRKDIKKFLDDRGKAVKPAKMFAGDDDKANRLKVRASYKQLLTIMTSRLQKNKKLKNFSGKYDVSLSVHFQLMYATLPVLNDQEYDIQDSLVGIVGREMLGKDIADMDTRDYNKVLREASEIVMKLGYPETNPGAVNKQYTTHARDLLKEILKLLNSEDYRSKNFMIPPAVNKQKALIRGKLCVDFHQHKDSHVFGKYTELISGLANCFNYMTSCAGK